jgi:hypothetical protein
MCVNLSDPVVKCPFKSAGQIKVEVLKYKAASTGSPKLPVGGVMVDVTMGGKTLPSLTTSSEKGEAVSGKLKPGSYTVDLQFPPSLAEKLDLASAITTDTKSVAKAKITHFSFLVPYNWVKFEVRYEDGSWAPGIPFALRRKKMTGAGLEQNWSMILEARSLPATTEQEVPAGKYLVALKVAWDPTWSADRVMIGEAIDLSASVSGFEVGESGSIVVLDAKDHTTVVTSLSPKVAAQGSGRVLKSSWTPDKAGCANLKSGKVVFSAKLGSYTCFSQPIPVFLKEPLDVEDDDGNKLTTKVKLRFSGGHVVEKDIAGGHANIEIPWGQKLTGVELPDHKGKRLSVEADGIPTRTLITPV